MIGRDGFRRSTRRSDVAPDRDFSEGESEGRSEFVFVLLFGAIYGIAVGLFLRGEFAIALVSILSIAACIWFGWWIRGLRS